MDASGRDVCPSSSSRCFLDLCNEHNLSIIARLAWINSNSMEEFQNRIVIQYVSIIDASLVPRALYGP